MQYQQIFCKRSKQMVVKVYKPYTTSGSLIQMSSSVTTTTNGVVVNTHVNPYGNGMGVAGVASTPHCLGQTVSSVLGGFRAGHPKALGTVPIMIGLMMLLTGIVMATAAWLDNIGVVSGIFVWGSIIGRVVVAMVKKEAQRLMANSG
ncbi:unnamed protein product [Coregonus sp. 'balchen']|nr:unnamed protein product [Coregonus sp. 'balchen']